MVQNTSDIIYSVNKYCQVELNVCDIKYLPFKLKFVILINCLADCSSIAKFRSLAYTAQAQSMDLYMAIYQCGD